jgi:hypothetical protein
MSLAPRLSSRLPAFSNSFSVSRPSTTTAQPGVLRRGYGAHEAQSAVNLESDVGLDGRSCGAKARPSYRPLSRTPTNRPRGAEPVLTPLSSHDRTCHLSKPAGGRY